MRLTRTVTKRPPGRLGELEKVELLPEEKVLLDRAAGTCLGPAPWRSRKRAEAHNLLALAHISRRFTVKELNIAEPFLAVLAMDVPVPVRVEGAGGLTVVPWAILGLAYVEEAVWKPQPGYAYFQVLSPNWVWHANVGPVEKGQPLCLGPRMPAAISIEDLVLLAYGAISLQTVQIDEMDSAGVLNPEAARWWQSNRHRIPLTKEAFIRPSPKGGV